MANERWGYADSRDAESWSGVCLTREQAIAKGREHYSFLNGRGYDGFWIHSGHLVPLEAVMPDVDDIIETMGERAYDEAGEVAEEYPDVTAEAKAELEELLRGWCEKYARPTFWVADGVAEFISGEAPRG